MDEEYSNVSWDIQTTTDIRTPYDLSGDVDPLSSLSDEMSKSFAEISTQRIALDSEEVVASSSSSSSRDLPPFASSSSSRNTALNLPSAVSSFSSAQQLPEPSPYPPPSPVTVTVTDPQKESDGSGIFTSYRIMIKASSGTLRSTNAVVRRRFQDFVWLHGILNTEFPQCVVPPMPEKHRMVDYLTGDRFSPDFIEKRRMSLQRFLQRVTRHPVLQQSEHLRSFLESRDFKNDKAARAKRDQSVFDNIGDVLMNTFVKIRKPDDRFVEMRENVDKLEENLNMVSRLYTRISKRQSDLRQDYTDFAASVKGLADLETGVAKQLGQFANTTHIYVEAMKNMSEREELEYLSEIHEYLNYCGAVKNVLRLRDQKQLDFEGLTDYLQKAIAERDSTAHPRTASSGIDLRHYINDKLNDIRGVDHERARQSKLFRLNQRIDELQEEVVKSNDTSNLFSAQVTKEFDIFQQAKAIELKDSLAAYTDVHAEFYKKGIELWENLIPVLESIQVED